MYENEGVLLRVRREREREWEGRRRRESRVVNSELSIRFKELMTN